MAAPGVKSASRALAVLELLAELGRPVSFAELAETLGYPRSSLHGLLRTMEGQGWLEAGEHGRYTLGIKTFEVGNSYVRATDLAGTARPYMQRVSRELNETVQLAILDGLDCVYIGKIDGSQALTLQSAVGRRLHAHASGIGKVLLAGEDPKELAERMGEGPLTEYTRGTITDVQVLRKELDQVRRQGFAEDDEEYTPGVRCVAVPVRGVSGEVVAGMSVAAPAFRLDGEQRQLARQLLSEECAQLSQAFGYLRPRPQAER